MVIYMVKSYDKMKTEDLKARELSIAYNNDITCCRIRQLKLGVGEENFVLTNHSPGNKTHL